MLPFRTPRRARVAACLALVAVPAVPAVAQHPARPRAAPPSPAGAPPHHTRLVPVPAAVRQRVAAALAEHRRAVAARGRAPVVAGPRR